MAFPSPSHGFCARRAYGGIVVSLGLTRLLRSQLCGVQPDDPRLFAVCALTLLIPVFLAAFRPALRQREWILCRRCAWSEEQTS